MTMRQSRDFLPGAKKAPLTRPGIWIPVVILISVPVVVLARSSGDDVGMTTGALVLMAITAVAVAALLWQWGRMVAGIDPEATQLATHLASGADQQRLLSRWMARARRARNIGGLCGLTAWALGTQFDGDVLLFGVGGIAIGAMLAELHYVRPQGGRRRATLDVRALGDYLTDHDRRLMIGCGIADAGLLVVALAIGEVSTAAWSATAGLVVLGAAHLVQRRVATRPRPALTDSLRQADDLARELAIGRGLAHPAAFFSIALLAHGVATLEPSVGSGATVVAVLAWCVAGWLWWRNRRLGLDFVVERARPVLA